MTNIVPVQLYNLGISDRIHDCKNGVDYVCHEQGLNGYHLRQVAHSHINTLLSHEEFHELYQANELEIHQGYYSAEQVKVADLSSHISLSAASEAQQKRALLYADLCTEYLRRFEAYKQTRHGTRISTSDECLNWLLPEIRDEVQKRWDSSNRGRFRGITLPSSRQFRRHLKRFKEFGYEAKALLARQNPAQRRNTQLSTEDRVLRKQFALKYASPEKPSMAVLYRNLIAEIRERNAALLTSGNTATLLTEPSRKTFEKLIKDLNPFWLMAKRDGADKATRYFGITTQGNDVTRPGERIEIDEWKVDLMTLLADLDLLKTLTPAQVSAVQRARLWLTVAIDCASRCILAMRFSSAPSSRSALDALEQIMVDKSDKALGSNAQSPWFQHCKPESIVTDTGSAFFSTDFRVAVADLRIEHSTPPPGQPRLRPFIESFFKTCKEYLSFYAGRTFSDYLEKGDYDPVARASVTADVLNRDFVRMIVDVYHNTPHSGLAFETPANAWLRLSNKYGVLPPPPKHIRTRSLGVVCRRAIGDAGVRILGLHYQSTELQGLRVDHRVKNVELRFNRFDLSMIEVKVNDREWLTVNNRFGLPEGVSCWEWLGAARKLSQIHATNAAIAQPIMMMAINELRESGEAASARAESGRDFVTDKEIQHHERMLFNNLRFIESERRERDTSQLADLHAPSVAYSIGADFSSIITVPSDEKTVTAETIKSGAGGQFGSASSITYKRSQ